MANATILLGGVYTSGYPGLGAWNDPANPPLFIDLPLNKQLTIESISASASAPEGQSSLINIVVSQYKTGKTIARYEIPLQYQATFNPGPTNPASVVRDYWSMDQSLRAYVPAGARLELFGMRGPGSNGPGGVEVVITGQLETTFILQPPFHFPAL